jgi:hypothetical protein
VHAYIISELRNEMPSMFGKDSKKKDLIKNIGNVYDRLQREHQISPGTFPLFFLLVTLKFHTNSIFRRLSRHQEDARGLAKPRLFKVPFAEDAAARDS